MLYSTNTTAWTATGVSCKPFPLTPLMMRTLRGALLALCSAMHRAQRRSVSSIVAALRLRVPPSKRGKPVSGNWLHRSGNLPQADGIWTCLLEVQLARFSCSNSLMILVNTSTQCVHVRIVKSLRNGRHDTNEVLHRSRHLLLPLRDLAVCQA
jgi:hypothetical protein